MARVTTAWILYEQQLCRMTVLTYIDGPWKMWPWFWKYNFELITQNSSLDTPYKITPRWMPQTLNNDKSTLVEVMAWCRQATSHYFNPCWSRSISSYGVTRPQCLQQVKVIHYTGLPNLIDYHGECSSRCPVQFHEVRTKNWDWSYLGCW